MKTLRVKVSRFDPQTDTGPTLVEYEVRVHEGARILHVLHAIHDTIDPTLSFRSSCEAGQCGSCAVVADGKPVLACYEEAREGMVIGPLALPVIRDLVVDLVPALNDIPGLVPKQGCQPPSYEEMEAIKPLRSCISCLACLSVCPAVSVIRFAGPTAMRQEMRLALDPRDSVDRVTQAVESGLFTCTSCQACWKVCPKDIRIPGKAIEKLRALAGLKGLTLPRHREVNELIRTTGRSVAPEGPSFLEQVDEVIEPDGEVKGTVGFFVGCMYTMRLPMTPLDAITVLKRNGIRVVIPKEQICCGSPLIRTGQPDYVRTLQRRNIDAFAFRGIKTVMTMCAGCGSTLKHDYPETTPFRVMDISEVLLEYGIEKPARLNVRATYHDPCHLLRGQGISSGPRELISEVIDLVEMPSVCCGSGGGVRSGVPEEAHALAEKRQEEIKKTGAEWVISSCPFCEFHIAGHTPLPVKNITSVLAEGYREKDRRSHRENQA